MSRDSSLRFACLLVPDYLVALARRGRPELRNRPVVIGGAPEEHGEVRACSAEAAAAGIMPGMSLRRALALCREAVFLPYREAEALAVAGRIVEVLSRHSPVVEAVEPGHVHFDIRGLAALAGMDEESYLEDLLLTVGGRVGLALSLGAAESLFAAHAAALTVPRGEGRRDEMDRGLRAVARGRSDLAIVREAAGFLGSLPVEVLPVPPAMQQRLRLLGLERLGQIADLPFSAMQAQFGRVGARAWRLARGEDNGVLDPRREELQVAVRMDLPVPAITSGQLLAATGALLQRALTDREVRGRSLRCLEWRLLLESGEVVKRRIAFREPTRDGGRILFVLRNRIEALTLPSAGVAAEVILSGFCSEYAQQGNLWGSGPRRRRELLDSLEQLAVRAGEPQVFRIVEVEPWSRIPERQLALAPYGP